MRVTTANGEEEQLSCTAGMGVHNRKPNHTDVIPSITTTALSRVKLATRVLWRWKWRQGRRFLAFISTLDATCNASTMELGWKLSFQPWSARFCFCFCGCFLLKTKSLVLCFESPTVETTLGSTYHLFGQYRTMIPHANSQPSPLQSFRSYIDWEAGRSLTISRLFLKG